MPADVSQLSDQDLQAQYQKSLGTNVPKNTGIPGNSGSNVSRATSDPSSLSDDQLKQMYYNQKNASDPIIQGAKGLYDNVPFGKDLAKLIPGFSENMDSTPNPQGFAGKAGRFVGDTVGQAVPMAAGAALLPGSPLIGAATGAAAQAGGKSSADGSTPLQAAGTGALAGGLTYAGGKALDFAAGKIGDALSPVGQKISEVIGDLYNKAIKPTTSKGNFNLFQASQDDAESAIRSIVKNRPNLELGDEGVDLPQNLSHMSEAISQTKNNIFNAYNEMQKQATGKGLTLDPEELAKPLDDIINSKSMKVVSPQTVQYAQAVKERLIGTDPVIGPDGKVLDPGKPGIGELTPEEAQDMIKGYNGRLSAFYKNPSPNESTNTAVDALIANNARKQLDDAITQGAGPGYQELKNQYGSLSAIEKDVARATQRASNYQGKSLLDFSDIFTGDQIVRGVLTKNPAEMASGAFARGVKEVYRYLNNPNTTVQRMFGKVSDLMDKEEAEPMFKPLGGLLDAIPKRMGVSDNFNATKNLDGMGDINPVGEANAQPIVNKPSLPENDIGGESQKMIGEGGPVNRVKTFTGGPDTSQDASNMVAEGGPAGLFTAGGITASQLKPTLDDQNRFKMSPAAYTKNEEGFDPVVRNDNKGRVVGYGFNSRNPAIWNMIPQDVINSKRPLQPSEADAIYPKAYNMAKNDAIQFAGNNAWNTMSPRQQQGLTDMSYQMGLQKLKGFSQLRAAIQSGNWDEASKQVLNSKYAKEVSGRANRSAMLIGRSMG